MQRLRKLTAVLLTILMVFMLNLSVKAIPLPKEITILTFNDFHGSLEESGKNIGAAKLTAEIKRIKGENPYTYVVSGGDQYQGSALSNLLYGKPVTDFMKEIGVVASAIGNHEFDWGTDRISNWASEGAFDFLAANIYDKSTDKIVSYAKPYKVITAGDIKIGLIGLSTPETEYKTKPDNVKDVIFKDPKESAKKWAKDLKEGTLPEGKVDIVIVLSHLSSFKDSSGNITGEAAEICAVENVDGVISAHSHQSVSGYVNGKPIVQAYYNGRSLGGLKIKIDDDRKLIGIEPFVDPLYSRSSSLNIDSTVKTIIDGYKAEVGPILDEVLGSTDKELEHDKNTTSILGEWVCDVMRKKADVQIAITNGGGLRTSIKQGNITMGNLYEVMPFDNTLVKMKLTGAQLKKAIENGIMNTNVGWVQLSGVKVYYDSTKDSGNRITSMKLLDGTKVEMDKYYTIVTNDFMATGGDNYDFTGALDVVDTGIPIRDALVDEIRTVKNLFIERVGYLIAGEDPNKEEEKEVEEEKNYVVITPRVGLRIREAEWGNILGVIPYGTKVELLEDGTSWIKVKYNNITGYVYKKYTWQIIKPDTEALGTAVVNVSGLNVRTSPWGKIVGVLRRGNTVEVLGDSNEWLKINYKGNICYIYKRYTSSQLKEPITLTVTAKVGLRIRASYSTSSKILGLLKYSTRVESYGRFGSWYKVKYNGIEGYIHSKYVEYIK